MTNVFALQVKQAEALLDQLNLLEKSAAPASKDLVNMDSTGGRLADYLAPGSWGGERAGRSQSLAAAAGADTSFGVRHPSTQTLGYGLGGGLLGGGIGAGIGALAGGPVHDDTGSMIGGLIGAGTGSLAGVLLAGHNRRNKMKEINQVYDAANEEGLVSPKTPNFSGWSAALLSGRGPHRSGQREAVMAMREGKPISGVRPDGRSPLYAANEVAARIHPIGGLLGLGHRYGQNLKTQFDPDGSKASRKQKSPKQLEDVIARLREERAREQEDASEQKAASLAELTAHYMRQAA